MHIERVEITALHIDSRQCAGVVILTGRQGSLTCDCRVKTDGPLSRDAAQRALLDEALRQLRRMPEYRHGGAGLSFGADALPA